MRHLIAGPHQRRRPVPRRPARVTHAEARDEADRQTTSLAAVAVILALLTIGLFLVHTLRHTALVEDCLMANRRDCDSVARAGR